MLEAGVVAFLSRHRPSVTTYQCDYTTDGDTLMGSVIKYAVDTSSRITLKNSHSVIVTNDALKFPDVPADRTVYRVPYAKLIEGITTDVKLRRLVVNMIYVGVLAELLDIETAEVDRALQAQLGKKPKAFALNQAAVAAGHAYAREHFFGPDPRLR